MTENGDPYENALAERMNRTIKEATVYRYHYLSHDELKSHLQTFLMAYNFARRLKALKGLTPYEFICKTRENSPDKFKTDSDQFIVGLNS